VQLRLRHVELIELNRDHRIYDVEHDHTTAAGLGLRAHRCQPSMPERLSTAVKLSEDVGFSLRSAVPSAAALGTHTRDRRDAGSCA
jgi:hypothetical protein